MNDYFMNYVEVNTKLAGAAKHMEWLLEELKRSDRKDRVTGQVTIEQAERYLQEIRAEFAAQDQRVSSLEDLA
jgi:hypothetical protein